MCVIKGTREQERAVATREFYAGLRDSKPYMCTEAEKDGKKNSVKIHLNSKPVGWSFSNETQTIERI